MGKGPPSEIEIPFAGRLRPRGGCHTAILTKPRGPYRGEQEQSEGPLNSSVAETNWGNYAIESEVVGLGSFVEIWNKLWFFSDWREKHLIDNITHLSLDERDRSESRHGYPEATWVVNSEIQEQFRQIEKVFNTRKGTFLDTFLSQPQRAEMMGIYYSFKRCFFRYELLGTARDLLPFFVQLANAMSLLDEWRQHFQGAGHGADASEWAIQAWRMFNSPLK